MSHVLSMDFPIAIQVFFNINLLSLIHIYRSDPANAKAPRALNTSLTSPAKATLSPPRLTSASGGAADDDDDDGLSYSSTEHDASGAHDVSHAGALRSGLQTGPSGEFILRTCSSICFTPLFCCQT